MNKLSWFIYLIEIAGRFSIFLQVLCMLGGIAFITVCLALMSIEWSDLKILGKIIVWIMPFVVLLTVLMPSSNTLYMIAASEAGEAVVNTPEAKELLDAVKIKLLDELKVQHKE